MGRMDILVGYTGFVGSNLHGQHEFCACFNSANITEAFGLGADLCVYAGVRAEKFTADRFPEQDMAHINVALHNIRRINAKKFVLISTVDVVPPQSGDIFESTPYERDKLTPYGRNRLYLEHEARKVCPGVHIIRLPGLFGKGLKKNFIYDAVNFIPAMLKGEKFRELNGKLNGADGSMLERFYNEDANGFFRLAPGIPDEDRAVLRDIFKSLGFSALNFTDSRAVFQFHNLDYLWAHIKFALENNIRLLHLAVEPVSAREVCKAITGADFINEISDSPPDYSFFKTEYAGKLHGSGGYIFNRRQVLSDITDYASAAQR